jgi:oligoribonuclease NrnB/cAMP/cGMP phosphodiesterase (DHH superfamily)
MVARPLIMTPYKPPESFLKSKMQNIDKNASDSLANWANNNEISTVSFESIFCTNQVCNRYLNSNWLFRDGSHLSTAGAALTIPELLAFLRKF